MKTIKTTAVIFATACSATCAQADVQGNYAIELGGQTYQANNAVTIDQFDSNFAGYNPRHSQIYGLGENGVYLQASRAGFTVQAYKKQQQQLSI